MNCSPFDVSIGSTGIRTSAVALGCDRLGSLLTPLNRTQSIALVREALDLGIRHFDTASIYGQGDSERIIGAAIKGRRNEVCIATKAGQRLTAPQAIVAKFKTPLRLIMRARGSLRERVRKQRATGVDYRFDSDFIEASLSSSLRRLQTDRADIFYLHSPPLVALEDERLMMLLERQRKSGRIGAIGVSCDDWRLALAAARHPAVEVVQYTLSKDKDCQDVIDAAARNGKSSLVRGIARHAVAETGSYENSLAVGFQSAMSLPSVHGVIVGTTSIEHLRANCGALYRKPDILLGTG